MLTGKVEEKRTELTKLLADVNADESGTTTEDDHTTTSLPETTATPSLSERDHRGTVYRTR